LKENAFWVKANEQNFANDELFQVLNENFSTKKAKKMLNDSSKDPQSNKAKVKQFKLLDDKQGQNLG
jgi:hypothetical protein